MDEKRKLAALYRRLSKEDIKGSAEDESRSIINQGLLLKEYAKLHGYEVFKEYTDDDYSGLYQDRPGFEELIHDAESKKFDIIIAKSQARFTRNMEHMEHYLHYLFPLWGIRFIGIVDGADTAIASNKKSRQINGLTNEWYSEDLSANVKAGLRASAKQGKVVSGFVPYGYIKDPEDRSHLIRDPETAPIVQRIFTMYLEGTGTYRIAQALTEEGILTPLLYKREQGLYANPKGQSTARISSISGHWSPCSINNMLREYMYTGAVVRHRQEKASYKHRKVVSVPKEDWIVVEDIHEPIVSKEDFQRVQEIRAGKVQRRDRDRPHPFAGKVFCGLCGDRMRKVKGRYQRADGVTTTKQWLRCVTAVATKKQECDNMLTSYQTVELSVLQEFERIIALLNHEDYKIMQQQLRERMELVPEQSELLRKKYVETVKSLKYVEEAITNIYLDKVSGKISEDEFYIIKDNLIHRQVDLAAEKQSLEERIRQKKAEEVNGENHAFEVQSMIRQFLKRKRITFAMAQVLIKRIDVFRPTEHPEVRVVVTWNF